MAQKADMTAINLHIAGILKDILKVCGLCKIRLI